MNRASILPISLNAKGRCCLVVGGGPAAVIKVDALLQSGIDVRVVATQTTEPMRLLAESPPPPITIRSKCIGATTVLAKINPAEKGKVYLVGAGPGNSDLLTLRAATLLASSDIVLHDDLISEEIRSVAALKPYL